MKKILIILIILTGINFNVFAKSEVIMPQSVTAYKENENYNFEIKNANSNDKIEIEVISDGDVKSKSTIKKNIIDKGGKKVITITQNELDKKIKPSSGYKFRLRLVRNGKPSNFTESLHLGKAPVFRNYSTWAYNDLLKASELKLFSKEIASNVSENITREELAEIVLKAYEYKFKKISQGSINHFDDTDNEYVNRAYDLHLINGNGNGKFNPKGEVKREDYAVVVSNLFGFTKVNDKADIKDLKDISNYARDFVYSSLNEKLLNLDENGKFNPKKSMTREEVISSIVRNL